MSVNPTFSLRWYDYAIFMIVIISSSLIGIYFGCFGSKQRTANEYIMGDKKMKILPVALSVAVSHFSSITLLGVPADIYRFGASYWLSCISMFLVVFVTVYVYLPVFFNLEIVTIYEYLEKRFDRKTRRMASFLYVLSDGILCPLAAYTPALALAAATGIDVHIIVFIICGICVCYTAIGGLKTVIWTDFLQLLIIVASLTVIYTIGLKSQGGFLAVWNKAVEGKRLEIFDFDVDPTKRDSFWMIIIGSTVHSLNYISLTQGGMQKVLTLPTFRACVWSLIYVAISMSIVITFCVFIGFVLYAEYSNCDPLMSKKISRHDQIVPYYILHVMGNIPCISGIFMGTITSASLSSLSSSFNAMAGVVYKDFIMHFLKKDISEETASNILKVTVVIIGFICTVSIFLLEHLGEIIPLVISLIGIVAGPSMGIFTLGVLFPKANAKGAFYGAIGGLIAIASIVVPIKYYQYQSLFSYPPKPLSVEDCLDSINLNVTTTPSYPALNNSSLSLDKSTQFQPHFIFRISYYYHCLIGASVTVLLGLLISYMTNKSDYLADKKLLSPICHFLLPKESEEEESQQFMENKNPELKVF